MSLALMFAVSLAHAEPVDLILVLATDVSDSIGEDEYQLQKQGIVDALTDPAVHEAARRCAPRGIALTYAEWSGCHRGDCVQFDPAVPFRVLGDAVTFGAFAHAVAGHPRSYRGDTDIEGALRESARLIEDAPYEAERRVIDLASGGIQNVNHTGRLAGAVGADEYARALGRARDEVVANGVVINALLIDDLKGAPGYRTMPQYFRDLIQGGPGAFTEVIRSAGEMHRGLRAKLTREICADANT